MQPLDWFVGQVWAKQMKELELDITDQCNSLRAFVSYHLGKRVIVVQESYIFRSYVHYPANPAQVHGRGLNGHHELFYDTRLGPVEHGVNRIQPKALKEEDKIGTLKLRVKYGDLNLYSAKAFYVVEVGLERFISPLVFHDEKGRFTWEILVELPVYDITSDVRVLVYRSNFLWQDRLLGQIIIPLVEYFPKALRPVKLVEEDDAFTVNDTFELFPVLSSTKKFVPASMQVPGSGMPRPLKGLGTITVESELCLLHNSIWRYYLTCKPLKQPEGMCQTSPAALISVSDRIRETRRHMSRINDAWVRFKRVAYPVEQLIATLRSWRYPTASLSFLVFSPYIQRYLDLWTFPLVLYFVFLSCVLYKRYTRAHGWDPQREEPLLWQDQTSDPDADLTRLQWLAKINYGISQMEGSLGETAGKLEKLFNAFSWTDERITILSLVLLLVLCCLVAGFIRLLEHIPLLFLVAVYCTFPFHITLPLHLKSKHYSYVLLAYCENIITRIPSQDEHGHREIARKQRRRHARSQSL